jgi:hypothetical protein
MPAASQLWSWRPASRRWSSPLLARDEPLTLCSVTSDRDLRSNGAREGEAYFYDLNALSNFVADAPNVIGFNPYVDLVELIIERAGLVASGASAA